MSGYDPAGTERYHLMMRQQHRYYARRFGVPLKLGPFEQNTRPQSNFSHFTINAEWPEGETTTHYYVSDWGMEVQQDAARSFAYRAPRYLYWYFKTWIVGVFAPLFKRQFRAAIVFSVPLIAILLRILLFSLFITASIVIARIFDLNSLITSGLTVALSCLGFLATRRLGAYFKTLYEPHLTDSVIFQCKLSDNNTEVLEVQAANFSREIIDLIDKEKPDEVYIIGHSCGCFHSLPAHKAVLDARRSGEHFANFQALHITFGSLLPYTTIYKKNVYFRELTVQLLEDKDTNWIEFFAPHDPFSIPHIRLDRDYGFELSAPLPARYQIRSAVFSEVFQAKKLNQFKYNPLRMHFQYLTANDVAGSYDFFYIITHPQALSNDLRANKQT